MSELPESFKKNIQFSEKSRYNILIEAYEEFIKDLDYKYSQTEILYSFYFLSGYFGVNLRYFNIREAN